LCDLGLADASAADLLACEGAVLDLFADLVRAPADAWTGAVTTGCAEGTLRGLRLARDAGPDGIVLRSAMAHDGIADATDILAMRSDVVGVDQRGEMDYGSLAAKLAQHRHRRPIIVATAGTRASGAVDDVHRIAAACEELGIHDRYIHVDAPLSGVPLSVAPP